MNALVKFIRDEDGLTVLEYVVGAGLLVAALLIMFANYGTLLQAKLESIFTLF